MTVTPPARRPASPARTRVVLGRRLTPVAALAVGALAIAGCGADDASTTNAAATSTGAVPRPVLADDVPARSAAFAEGTIRPDGRSGEAVSQLADLIGAGRKAGAKKGSTSKGSGASKDRGVAHRLLPEGTSFREDVLPHLGDHAAAFLLGGEAAKAGSTAAASSTDGAIVAEVKDADALREALGTGGKTVDVGGQTVRIQGDRATWVGDGVAALGTENGVRAAIAAADGADLAGNTRFTGALEQIRATDPIGVAWVDMQQTPALNGALAGLLEAHTSTSSRASKASKAKADDALGALPKSLRDQVQKQLGAAKGSSASKGSASSPVGRLRLPASDATSAAALELTPGVLTVRSGGTGPASATDPKAAQDAVAALPAGSWAAFGGSTTGVVAKIASGAGAASGSAGLSKLLGGSLDGLLKTLQGVEVVSGGVQGQSLFDAGGAAVLKAKDDEAANALLRQLGDLVGGRTGLKATPTKIEGTSSGVVIGLPGLPLEIAAGVQGDRVAVGLGAESITKALASDERLSGDPLYARAKEALGGAAPTLILQPKPLTDLIDSLGGFLGGSMGGAGGAGGLGALMGSGGSGGSSSGAAGGLGGLLGSGGLTRVTDVLGRVRLATATREKTGSSTWSGTLVVQYDGAAEKPVTP